jgi:hypothetical protein
MLLYALVPLCALLLALTQYLPSIGGLHTLAGAIVVILVIGLAAVWVRGNRHALARLQVESEDKPGPRATIVQVNDSSPQVIHLKWGDSRKGG